MSILNEVMGDLDNLGGAIGGFLGGTGGALLGAGLSIDELNKITDIANRSAAGQERIGREAQEASAFRPFTVSTGFGGIQNTAAASGKTGDIKLTTTGASSGDSYVIVLTLIKEYS